MFHMLDSTAGSAATGSIPSASTVAPSTQASEPAGAFSVVSTAPVQLFSNATAFNLTDVTFEVCSVFLLP